MDKDRKKFTKLLFLLTGFFFAYPLLDDNNWAELILDLGMTFSLIWTLASIGRTKTLIATAILTAMPIFTERLINSYFPNKYLEVIQYSSFYVMQFWACVTILKRILHTRDVVVEHILAATCVYLLSCFMWANIYSTLEIIAPLSFRILKPGASTFSDLLYFSTTTLTTNNFGDVIPIGQLSKALAAFEGLTGQLYIAIFISYIVGAHGNRIRNKQSLP